MSDKNDAKYEKRKQPQTVSLFSFLLRKDQDHDLDKGKAEDKGQGCPGDDGQHFLDNDHGSGEDVPRIEPGIAADVDGKTGDERQASNQDQS